MPEESTWSSAGEDAVAGMLVNQWPSCPAPTSPRSARRVASTSPAPAVRRGRPSVPASRARSGCATWSRSGGRRRSGRSRTSWARCGDRRGVDDLVAEIALTRRARQRQLADASSSVCGWVHAPALAGAAQLNRIPGGRNLRVRADRPRWRMRVRAQHRTPCLSRRRSWTRALRDAAVDNGALVPRPGT